MSQREKEDQVVLLDKTYAATVDPTAYDEFMDAWDDFLAPNAASMAHVDLSQIESGPIHIHFNRAVEILERMAAKQHAAHTAETLVQQHDGVGVVINRLGKVIAANAEALETLQCEIHQPLAQSQLRASTTDTILAWVSGTENYLVFNGYTQADDSPLRLLAVTVDAPDKPGELHYFISSIDLRLSDEVKAKLKTAFSLSEAELSVAQHLLRGESPNEIAAARSASINTVRSQIKSILQKMDTRGIADLVRVLCAFVANASSEHTTGRRAQTTSALSRRYVLERPDGREIRVTEHGASDGTPVLMFHAMLWGVELPTSFIDACAQKNVRIIAPARPGYGGAQFLPDTTGSDYIDAAVDDARFVLDKLDITEAIALGHIVGSIYAQRFAKRFPKRCKGLLFVSHAPYWQDDFLARFPRRQRLVARTARIAPGALGFVTRAGAALIESGGHDRFLLALHGDIPEDAKALRRPDIHAVLCAGIEFTTRVGTSGFCQDCQIGMQDWSAEVSEIQVPIRILYGANDRIISQDYIDGYLRAAPDAQSTRLEGAGMHVLYSHWPQVIKALGEF